MPTKPKTMTENTSHKLLLIICLQPFSAKTKGETRFNKLLSDLNDICHITHYKFAVDYVYPTSNGGGQTWAKDSKNEPRVRQYRANLRHRLERVKPDLILVSGRHTAIELNRILKPIEERGSQLKGLYRREFSELRALEIKTLMWSSPALMTPCLGHYGQSKIRQTSLPDLYWETLFMQILIRLQDLPGAQHNLEAKAELRRDLSAGVAGHDLPHDEFARDGFPIIRLPEDMVHGL